MTTGKNEPPSLLPLAVLSFGSYKPRDRIRLDDVIRRDGGICYLCGCETDKADRYMTASGYYACGPKYPTIDHVKPLVAGGCHTWENVRLACHSCNSKKGAKV